MKRIEDIVLQQFFRSQLLIVACGTTVCSVAVIVISLLHESVVPLLLLLPLLAVWLHLISMHARLARYGIRKLRKFEYDVLAAWLSENASATYLVS